MLKLISLALMIGLASSQSLECIMCTDNLEIISSEIRTENSTIELVSDIIIELCKEIGTPIVYEECKEVVKEIDDVLHWVGYDENPSQICYDLGLCKNKTSNACSRNF